MADLFISYSRRDQEFVRRLHGALRDQGKDAWVDWEDIPPTAKWRDEIRAAVAGSDAFGFVLTPESLRSEICGEELQMAVDQNKRIVPLLRKEPDGAAIPDHLAAHNWIFFSDDEAFEQSLQTLVQALETDVERTHLHTRLLVRAGEWDDRNRESSRLLRGNDLREAEDFLAQVDAQPEPTALQREYVAASRRATGRRLRVVLAGVSVALVLAVALGVVALIERNTAQQRERQAVSRSLAALAVTQLGVDPERGVLLATEAVHRNVTPEADLALRRAVGANPLRATLRHGGPVRWVQFSPNGRLVVTASDDHTARVWDAQSGRQLHVLSHAAEVNYAAFSRDGQEIVTASTDTTARAWQTATGQPIGPPLRAPVSLGKALLSGGLVGAIGQVEGGYGSLLVWDARSGKLVKRLGKPGDSTLTDFDFSPDGRLAATGSQSGRARIWNLSTGRSIELRGHTGVINRVAFSPDGTLVATGSDDGTARLWTRDGRTVAVLHGDQTKNLLGFNFVDGIEDLAFSPDGHYLVTAGLVRGDTRVWRIHDGRQVALLPGRASVYAVRFSPDSRLVVTAGVDSQTRLWEAFTGRQIAAFSGHTAIVNSVAFSPDGSRLATASADGTARLWETFPGRQLAQVPGSQTLLAAVNDPSGHGILTAGANVASVLDPSSARTLVQTTLPQPIVDAQISPDGQTALLVTASSLRLVDAATLGRRRSLTLQGPGHPAPYVAGPAMSMGGRRILCAMADGTAGVWDGVTGHLLAVLRPTGGQPTEVQAPIIATDITADGTRALIAQVPQDPSKASMSSARVWDTRSGRQLAVLRPGAAIASPGGAVFSPDGTRIAMAGANPIGQTGPAVWDARTGLRLYSLHDNFGLFNAAFSHDGRRLVTAGIAGTVTIWDVASGTGTPVQGGPIGAADHVQFSPDDRLIAVAGYDGTTRVFDVRTGIALAVLEGGLEPVLTAGFGSSDSPVLTVDNAGGMRLFACDVCGQTPNVLRAGGSLVTRTLTPGERATYLGTG